jgi:hypothetical protein
MTTPHIKTIGRSPLRLAFILIPMLVVCFGLSTAVRAVDPPPDGGYPGSNTAEGDDALFSLTTGLENTAVGFEALYSITGNVHNTAVGYQALANNTQDDNEGIGWHALFNNTTGYGNHAFGVDTLGFNTTGSLNTATGFRTLNGNTTGSYNTATGYNALQGNTSGDFNTASGESALYSNTTGCCNAAFGEDALVSNTEGNWNAGTGTNALFNNTTGSLNTGNGSGALFSNTTGNFNTASGFAALEVSTGNLNIALGFVAGGNLASGDNNIDIGNLGVAAESNTIRIGTVVPFTDNFGVTHPKHTATYVAGIMGKTVARGVPVFINANGQLGTATSSARFKDDIKPMDKASEAILALRPVTFRYKPEIDPEGLPQFGLVAEDVDKVNAHLVARDAEGKVYTVRYEAVNAMLLNEFLKEHRKVQEQEATIVQLKSTLAKQETIDTHQQEQIEALAAGLQKVSAQVGMSRAAPQVVVNDQ